MSSVAEIKYKDAIIKIILAFYPDAKIYLFGSYATKTARVGSDIDVAVDVGHRLDIRQHSFLKNLLDALPTVQKIDLVDMYKIPEDMRKEILNKGISWKL